MAKKTNVAPVSEEIKSELKEVETKIVSPSASVAVVEDVKPEPQGNVSRDFHSIRMQKNG